MFSLLEETEKLRVLRMEAHTSTPQLVSLNAKVWTWRCTSNCLGHAGQLLDTVSQLRGKQLRLFLLQHESQTTVTELGGLECHVTSLKDEVVSKGGNSMWPRVFGTPVRWRHRDSH